MAGLLDSLASAARALQAQQYAMDVVGQNIANVNTPGYARRVVDFVAVSPSSGGGVDVGGVRSVRDTLLERRLLQELPVEARDGAIADALDVVQVAIGNPGTSIDARLDAFFDAYADLAEDPTSPVVRHQVQLAGQALAGAFGDMASRLDAARQDANLQIQGAVSQIDTLAARIATINASLASGQQDTAALTLRDQQSDLVRQLSSLVGVHVLDRQDGGVDLTFGNGRPLVAGATSYGLDATPGPPSGDLVLTSQGTTVTADIDGGTLAGLLQVRDVNVPGYLASLDTLAANVVTQVNALHAAGFDQTGAAAGAFFTYATPPGGTSGTTGAAAAMQVDPAVLDDARLIAAAGVSDASGDNAAARAIAALRSGKVLDGGTATFADAWGRLVYDVGSDAKAAADARDSGADIVREVDALRDQVAGVSLDEEALNLLKFQRAYEANARFFTVVDQMLSTLLALGS